MISLSFAKGHGTRNDFVLCVDRDNLVPLSDDQTRFLCDRRAGIGGDGLLRAVKAEHIEGWTGDPELWFMDYRNADGSLAEMCGNGLRVFVTYLAEEGLIDTPTVQIGTRAGLRVADLMLDGNVCAHLGEATVGGQVQIMHAGRTYDATAVDIGNPHAVVVLDNLDDLAALDLAVAPGFEADDFPTGVNVEFIVPTGEATLAMRVFERGVGETMSCGTGVVAAASAWAAQTDFDGDEVTVDVPGGRLVVHLGDDVTLTGPAVIVARGEVRLDSLS